MTPTAVWASSRAGARTAAGALAFDAAPTASTQPTPRTTATAPGRAQVEAASTSAVNASAGSSQGAAVQDIAGIASPVSRMSGSELTSTAAVRSSSNREAG